jgi:hypothetical protein
MRCYSVGCGTGEPNAMSNAVGYAKHRSRSRDAVIRVYDETGNVIETNEHKGEFKEARRFTGSRQNRFDCRITDDPRPI